MAQLMDTQLRCNVTLHENNRKLQPLKNKCLMTMDISIYKSYAESCGRVGSIPDSFSKGPEFGPVTGYYHRLFRDVS
jgi:hypothetical protein